MAAPGPGLLLWRCRLLFAVCLKKKKKEKKRRHHKRWRQHLSVLASWRAKRQKCLNSHQTAIKSLQWITWFAITCPNLISFFLFVFPPSPSCNIVKNASVITGLVSYGVMLLLQKSISYHLSRFPAWKNRAWPSQDHSTDVAVLCSTKIYFMKKRLNQHVSTYVQ